MSNARFYDTLGVTSQDLAGSVSEWFRYQGFDTYNSTDPNGRIFVEGHRQNFVRSILGLSAALNVVFTPQAEGRVLVELGGALWGDKIGAGAVGFFLFPPLIVTAAIGAWQQSKLDEELFTHLSNYIFSRTGQYPTISVANPYAPYTNYPTTPAYYNYPAAPQSFDNGYYSYGYAPEGQQPPPSGDWPQPTSTTQKASWFEPESMQNIFSASVSRMMTWQKAMEDGVINSDELQSQERLVADLQKQAEDSLNTEQKIKLAEILQEMTNLESTAQV